MYFCYPYKFNTCYGGIFYFFLGIRSFESSSLRPLVIAPTYKCTVCFVPCLSRRCCYSNKWRVQASNYTNLHLSMERHCRFASSTKRESTQDAGKNHHRRLFLFDSHVVCICEYNAATMSLFKQVNRCNDGHN